MTAVRTSAVRKIYILSDSTGQSALHILRAALVQFGKGRTRVFLFHDIDSKTAMSSVLTQAREEQALVAFTFARREMRDHASSYCRRHGLYHLDILGPLIENLAGYLRKEPFETPTLLRRVDARYFKRIEAIEYTLGHDDGRGPERLREADIVLIGLSRTSKTPTSFFLAQEGYKVANVPIVPGIPLPEELFAIDQSKIVCLNIEPEVLRKIRKVRQKNSGLNPAYSNLRTVFAEVEHVWDLLRRHKNWTVVDTTNKSVEETAWEIIHRVFGESHEEFR